MWLEYLASIDKLHIIRKKIFRRFKSNGIQYGRFGRSDGNRQTMQVSRETLRFFTAFIASAVTCLIGIKLHLGIENWEKHSLLLNTKANRRFK